MMYSTHEKLLGREKQFRKDFLVATFSGCNSRHLTGSVDVHLF